VSVGEFGKPLAEGSRELAPDSCPSVQDRVSWWVMCTGLVRF